MTELVDPDAVAATAFGLGEDVPSMTTEWHAHARPQLLYAVRGAMRLETRDQVAVLPPDRAAWLPTGTQHRVVTGRPMHLRTVYFAPEPAVGGVVVFRAPALLREMALQACTWGLLPPEEPWVEGFFASFRGLIDVWRASPLDLVLPAPRSAELARGLAAVESRLSHPVAIGDVAKAGGMSTRTCQRRMREELGLGFAAWLTRARLLHATTLLADPELQIGEVALRSGYTSPASFTRTFRAHLGSTPSEWRQG